MSHRLLLSNELCKKGGVVQFSIDALHENDKTESHRDIESKNETKIEHDVNKVITEEHFTDW